VTHLQATSAPLHTAFDCGLLDLDGVIYRGSDPVPHAPGAVAEARDHGMRTMFVTNNASRTPGTVADHLTELGVPTGAEEVMTAAMAVAALIAKEADAATRVFVVGGRGLRQAVADEGLPVVDTATDGATVVVQGFDPELTWKDLAEAAYAIGRGAEHIASNLDQSLPTEHGLAPGNGALVAAVAAATGKQPRASGKPAPEIFQQAARACGARRPLVVGDRLDTDLEGARAAQFPGLWVNTGVDGPTQILQAARGQRPTFLADDLRWLSRPHPVPERNGQWWACGEAAARVDGGTVVVRRDGREVALDRDRQLTLDELRAAASATWTAADAAGVDNALDADFPQISLVDPGGSALAR